jgi:predicted DNA-binding protein (MmcQ/YjbR family)
VTVVPDVPTMIQERKYDANSVTYYFANKHWRHIIGQYSSNRAVLVDLMSNSRSEIDYELYYYHIRGVLVPGAYSFPMPFL